MAWVLSAIVGYVLGSVPVALIVARRHGVDLYRTSDGNPGAWNALEQLGARRAWPAFVGDALKGTLAGIGGLALGGGSVWVGYVAVAAAMLGHAFPLFARGRGGKSVLTFAGGMLALAPLAGAIGLAACLLVSLAARSFALGARVGVFGAPLIQLAVDPAERVAATGGLMTLVGALFGLRALQARRRDGPAPAPAPGDTSGRATSGPGAPPPR
jgi:glycerol-3-phosphate acyltransferase PlsY